MKPLKALIFILPFLFAFLSGHAQDTLAANDSIVDEAEADTTTVGGHSPKKAALMSAILPGLGQAYNDSYWKIPIVYAGIGTSTYFIISNQRNYKRFRQAYLARVDGDPTTKDERYQGVYTNDQLRTVQDTYRRWRDLSYIALAAVYLMNILDANVDAHLYDFDVSDELSMRITPRTWANGYAGVSGGVSLSLRLKGQGR